MGPSLFFTRQNAEQPNITLEHNRLSTYPLKQISREYWRRGERNRSPPPSLFLPLSALREKIPLLTLAPPSPSPSPRGGGRAWDQRRRHADISIPYIYVAGGGGEAHRKQTGAQHSPVHAYSFVILAELEKH